MENQNPQIPPQPTSPITPIENSNRNSWKYIAIGMSIVSFFLAIGFTGYIFVLNKNNSQVSNQKITLENSTPTPDASKIKDEINKIKSEFSIVWSPDNKNFFFVDKHEIKLPSGAITMNGAPEVKLFDTDTEN